MRIVFLGLSITSSWGNGHATNYRALLKALRRRGHDVLFLERDVPWYASARDFDAPYVSLYASVEHLRDVHTADVRDADLVVVGSYVPDGVEVGGWATRVARGATAFYDVDTPVTVAKLERGDREYLTPELVPRFDLYLSFTGGPLLGRLEREWGARRAVAFHCFVDPQLHRPVDVERRFAAGYLGTYSADRQPALERLLLEPARRLPERAFAVAGPQYPDGIDWPENVERIEHLPPAEHARFYCSQAVTVNVTRADMARAGWSPSVRLFEAGACGVPVLSDRWDGLDELFAVGREILVADTAEEAAQILRETDDDELRAVGERLRARVLARHTADDRAEQLERLVSRAGRAAGPARPRSGSAPGRASPGRAA